MITVDEFLLVAEEDPEIMSAFTKAAAFINRKNYYIENNVQYFFQMEENDYRAVEMVVKDYINLVDKYPFENKAFRDFLIKSDRIRAENLLSERSRGYSFDEVLEVITEAETYKANYKNELKHLWKPQTLSEAQFADAVRSCSLFSKVPYSIVKFYLTVVEDLPHLSSRMERVLFALFRTKMSNAMTAYPTLLAWDKLGVEDTCGLLIQVHEDGIPDWSPYMWKEYINRYNELKGVFLPWLTPLLKGGQPTTLMNNYES